jgi:hypothetical protein
LWNIDTGECLCTYFADTPLTACTAASNRDFIAGDSLGRMHFLHLEGSQPSGPLKSNQSAPPIAELQAKPAWLSFLGRMVSKLTRGRL